MPRATRLIAGFLLAVALANPGLAAEYNPARHPPADSQGPVTGRVIVRFRSTDRIAAAQARSSTDRVTALASRTGVVLQETRRIGSDLHVLQVGTTGAPEAVAADLARLRADPDVEFAEPDQRRYAHALPNDTLFPGQWYLQSAGTTPSAVNAVAAWDVTTGSAGVVIADLDTGVRFDHPDLVAASLGGRLLPGFDFVSDKATANDGDGWDSDASDPGDWVTASEANSLGCDASDSSWHGTRVAGIISARTNNALGVAGLGWSGWLLPVRVLGKCGGSDSDIISAMLWAGGIAVNGAPANPYPARVINMSLGGSGSCPQSYRDVISQLAARGVLVVASVGNEGSFVDAPANCPGVVGVGALRHAGTKVGFSNLGPGVALSAPGGNCVNPSGACLYSIDTTTNLGTQGPGTNAYTDQFNYNVGTSFSAPIVAGIAGLMAAVNGRLAPAQMLLRLQEGATRPFPSSTDPTVPVCHVPTSSSDLQDSECVCTTDTCGAGMANALGAVNAALRPITAIALQTGVSPGQNVVLSGAGSGAACDHALARYQWTIVNGGAAPPGIVGADTPVATVVAPATGSFTVRLTVTDDAGRQDSADVVVSANGATTSAPAALSGSACPTPVSIEVSVVVTISPTTASVIAGGSAIGFTASVANTSDTRLTWNVNGIVGGDATVGTISTGGTYTPPATVPDPSRVTVTAVSVADPSRSASATVTIAPSAPISTGSGGGGGGVVDLLVLVVIGARALARRARRD